MIELVRIFNLLFPLINKDQNAPDYFSGKRFLDKVRETDPSHPDYKQYSNQMKEKDERKSRKDYYFDILNSFSETNQIRIISSILDEIEKQNSSEVSNIRSLFIGVNVVPQVSVNTDIWNSERLNNAIQ